MPRRSIRPSPAPPDDGDAPTNSALPAPLPPSAAPPPEPGPLADESILEDLSNITPGPLSFVVHRQATRRWRISDLHHNGRVTLGFAVSGQAHYTVKGEQRTVKPGEMLFFDTDVTHSAFADPSKPWRFYAVAVPLFSADPANPAALDALAKLPWVAMADNPTVIESLFAELELRWSGREPGYGLRCRAIILTLLHAFVAAATRPENSAPHARQLIAVARFLQKHYTQSYPVIELARRTGLSESRFRTLFRKTLGVSVIRYQNTIRINRAQSLLLSGEHSVSEASKLVGIDDVFYFSRLFKKMTGRNPSELRPK